LNCWLTFNPEWTRSFHFNTNPIKSLHESGMSYNSIRIEFDPNLIPNWDPDRNLASIPCKHETHSETHSGMRKRPDTEITWLLFTFLKWLFAKSAASFSCLSVYISAERAEKKTTAMIFSIYIIRHLGIYISSVNSNPRTMFHVMMD
jgi:hypothetical protein